MTALTLLAKWTASSSSWKKNMNNLLCNLNISSMSYLKRCFLLDSRHLGLCQAHKPNVTCRAVPAGPGERRLVCHHSVPKRTKWEALWFLGRSQTTHSLRSQVWPEQGMHLFSILQYQSEAGNTPTGSPLEEMGCLEQGWGLVHSGSANYCEFTGVCLPKLQRTEDRCITAAFLPRLGLSKDQGRQYQTGALLEQRPWPLCQRQVSRGNGLRGCANLWGKAAGQRIS